MKGQLAFAAFVFLALSLIYNLGRKQGHREEARRQAHWQSQIIRNWNLETPDLTVPFNTNLILEFHTNRPMRFIECWSYPGPDYENQNKN